MILFAGSDAMSFAKDTAGVNSTSIVRSQLQSIAAEVIDSAKFDGRERVGVSVEGEGLRTLVENAFIEAFQNRNYTSVVIDSSATHQMLHVFLLTAENKSRELNAKVAERNIRTAIEARTVKGVDHEVRLLGTFQRETKDTIQVFTAGIFPSTQKNEENGILQRMLTPFVVVGGAIVIVYLFFTVRS
jgi:hypothetical protein